MADIGKLEKMREYFTSGATRTYAFRREQLRLLKNQYCHMKKNCMTHYFVT